MKEIIWKPIKGFEGLYEVSNTGLIKSLNCYNYKEPRIMHTSLRKDGYLSVGLSKNNKTTTRTVHRIVAETFLPNPNNLEMINHKDEDKSNNNVDNLEWCTVSYNNKYSIKRHPERFVLRKNREKRDYYKVKTKYFNVHINQFSKDGEFIKQWFNFAELKHIKNYNNTSIKECCEGKRKTAYGYKWEFANKEQVPFFI